MASRRSEQLMSTSGARSDDQIVVQIPEEASLDGLIAGLEASSQKPPQPNLTGGLPALAQPRNVEPAPRKERRGARRYEAERFKVELRLAVAGFPMRLVNLSATGLLAETSQRLSPGRTVDVFLRYGGVRKVLRATVMRSTMHAVAPSPVFRAALQFEDTLTLQDVDL